MFLNLGCGPSEPHYSKSLSKEKKMDYDWHVFDLKNNEVHLNQLKGQPILINFWATWCGPCIAEMPEFNRLYADYKDKIQFMMISIDEDKAALKAFSQQYDFPVFHIKHTDIPSSLKRRSIPQTLMVSSDGYIVLRYLGEALWNGPKTREFLDKLSSQKD